MLVLVDDKRVLADLLVNEMSGCLRRGTVHRTSPYPRGSFTPSLLATSYPVADDSGSLLHVQAPAFDVAEQVVVAPLHLAKKMNAVL
jgi:hypothetical protein